MREMDQTAFWSLIGETKREFGQNMGASLQHLTERLTALGLQQAMDFQDILRGYRTLANQYGLWCAAAVMRPDADEDEYFHSFRNWLIAQGQDVYLAALKNPDSLAEVEPYGYCEFEELDNAASSAVVKLTGRYTETSESSPANTELLLELKRDIVYGEGIGYPYEWEEMAEYLPRLCGKYLTAEELAHKIKTEAAWNPDHPEIQALRAAGRRDAGVHTAEMNMGGGM